MAEITRFDPDVVTLQVSTSVDLVDGRTALKRDIHGRVLYRKWTTSMTGSSPSLRNRVTPASS
jgi:hypothetical protein